MGACAFFKSATLPFIETTNRLHVLLRTICNKMHVTTEQIDISEKKKCKCKVCKKDIFNVMYFK